MLFAFETLTLLLLRRYIVVILLALALVAVYVQIVYGAVIERRMYTFGVETCGVTSIVSTTIYFIYLFRNSQFCMQYKRNIEDKRVQYET